MILPKDRYPKAPQRKKLTPAQRRVKAAAFVDRMVAEIQNPKHRKPENP